MISLMAPSRGRPDALREMVESARQMAFWPHDIEALAYVDEDDPSDYESLVGVTVVRGPRINLSDCWNKLAEQASGDTLHMSSDDIRFRTVGWDRMVEQAFASVGDGIAFVFGPDGFNKAVGTHGFISREWYEAVGRFTTDAFPCDYADTWLNDVADRIGRKVFLPDLYIEHLHPLAGKAEWDQTHAERLARGRAANLRRLWLSLEPQRQAEADILLRACS